MATRLSGAIDPSVFEFLNTEAVVGGGEKTLDLSFAQYWRNLSFTFGACATFSDKTPLPLAGSGFWFACYQGRPQKPA